jgi:hypothetical protein
VNKGEIMEIKSAQTGSSLIVHLDNIADKKAVLDTIQGCADGSCACSTDEYQKVETLQILPGVDSIQLNIEVKAGEIIDPNCISECLAPHLEA